MIYLNIDLIRRLCKGDRNNDVPISKCNYTSL